MKEFLHREGAREGLEEAARDLLQRWKAEGEVILGFDEFIKNKGGWENIKGKTMKQEDTVNDRYDEF